MEKLRNLRLNNKLRIKEISTIVGISSSYYWQLENKQRRLYYNLAKKIAAVFKLKPDDIFYEEY